MAATTDEQAGHGPDVGQVKHRHHMQKHRVGAIGARRHGSHRGTGDVVVTEHYPFGKPGGATGVENPQQGLATATHILHRWAVNDQRFVIKHAWRRIKGAGMNDPLHGHRLCNNLLTLLHEGVIDDQNRGFRVVQ
ncbi:hypothetical protein D3C76_987980 [compost metagenome]